MYEKNIGRRISGKMSLFSLCKRIKKWSVYRIKFLTSPVNKSLCVEGTRAENCLMSW